MKEKFKIVGYADYKVIDHFTGDVLKSGRSYNMVVNDGLERLAKLANGVSSTTFTKIAIGTSSTAPAQAQTALVAQHDIDNASCSYEDSYKATWEATFTFISETTITEAGVFTSDSKMLDRVIFDGETCGVDKDFYIKITLELSRA